MNTIKNIIKKAYYLYLRLEMNRFWDDTLEHKTKRRQLINKIEQLNYGK